MESKETPMDITRNKYNLLLNLLLFSGLGCFSYLFLIIYADLPQKTHFDLTSFWAFTAVSLIFNGLGLSLMQINLWLGRDYRILLQRKRKLIASCLILACLLFLLNYLLLGSIRWILEVPHPFLLRWAGVRLLASIWLVELVVVCLTMVNSFYRQMLVLHQKTAQLEDSSIQAQYTALQSQLNPHFLFNSLNTLISEIEYNPHNAVLFTRHLSDVYRYILQCQEQKLVTLGSELAFLDSYIFLHQVRLGNCIRVDNRLDTSLSDTRMPPLTLQLLAENVIKHNTIHAGKPMTITLTYDEQEHCLLMENEIRPKKGVAPSGTGLKNLITRYRLICDRSLVVTQDAHCFTVKIPLLNE